jgi:bifunctional DNA primase/polymerase-like protein
VARFGALCAELGAGWPDTLTVATPAGLHLYFRVPVGVTVGSTSGGRSALGAGIDTRGPGRRTGGYLVGPGSVVNGARYTVVRDSTIAELPVWLVVLLGERDRSRSVLVDEHRPSSAPTGAGRANGSPAAVRSGR